MSSSSFSNKCKGAAVHILKKLFSEQMLQKISEFLAGADLMIWSHCWMGPETLNWKRSNNSFQTLWTQTLARKEVMSLWSSK